MEIWDPLGLGEGDDGGDVLWQSLGFTALEGLDPRDGDEGDSSLSQSMGWTSSVDRTLGEGCADEGSLWQSLESAFVDRTLGEGCADEGSLRQSLGLTESGVVGPGCGDKEGDGLRGFLGSSTPEGAGLSSVGSTVLTPVSQSATATPSKASSLSSRLSIEEIVELELSSMVPVPPLLQHMPQQSTSSASSATLIPALKPPNIEPKVGGFTTCDWEQAALQAKAGATLSGGGDRKRKARKKPYIKETRPLGIVGHATVDAFQKVPSTRIEVFVRKDRYPDLSCSEDGKPFIASSPILRSLTSPPSGAFASVLQMLECGFRDPSHPHQPCRVLCPHVTSWEEHQYTQHGVGFLCGHCHQWFPDEEIALHHLTLCLRNGK